MISPFFIIEKRDFSKIHNSGRKGTTFFLITQIFSQKNNIFLVTIAYMEIFLYLCSRFGKHINTR